MALTIVVLGVDGAGKSTVARLLAERLSTQRRVCLVAESVTGYAGGRTERIRLPAAETFRQAVARFAKRAGSLKSYKIPKLAELLLRDRLIQQLRRRERLDLIVADGLPLLNMVAWSVMYETVTLDVERCARLIAVLTGQETRPVPGDRLLAEFPELRTLMRLRLNRLALPDVVIFLDVPLPVACERIAARGGKLQAHETRVRLEKLRTGYCVVCEVVRERCRIPIWVSDATAPPEAISQAASEFLAPFLTAKDHDHDRVAAH